MSLRDEATRLPNEETGSLVAHSQRFDALFHTGRPVPCETCGEVVTPTAVLADGLPHWSYACACGRWGALQEAVLQ